MSRRRVLFVDHAAVLGGAELSLLDLAIAYRETSRVLLFADGPFRTALEAKGVPVQVAPAAATALAVRTSSGLRALKALPALGGMARQIAAAAQGFELIHANSQKAFIAAALATCLGAPPVIWHLRDILTARHFSQLNRSLAIMLANRFATKVLVNSQATGAAFVTAGGDRDRVTVLYNGLDAARFDQVTAEQAQAIRTQLGIGNAPLVGVFSRLSYWKGQHILLEAMQHLPELQALIVGEALFGEMDYVAQIKALAETPSLAGRVHWLGHRSDIPILMSACDVVVHTSTEPEPFGRVIVEGQLAHRPVIATAAGGAIELIQDGVTGRLVPPGQPQVLAATIQNLLENPTQTQQLVAQGYVQARDRFSLETLLCNFDRILDVIPGKRKLKSIHPA